MTIRTLGCWLGASVVLHVSSSPRGMTLLRVLWMLGAVLPGVRTNLLLDTALPLQALEHLVPEAVTDLLANTRREIHLAYALALESRTAIAAARRGLTVTATSATVASTTASSSSAAIPSNELPAVRIVNALARLEDQGVVEVRECL
jgi:hypothetical protein